MHTRTRPMTTNDMRRNVERQRIQDIAKSLNEELENGATRAGSDGKSIRVTNQARWPGDLFRFSSASDARRALRLARKLIEIERGEQTPVFVPNADNDWED